MSHTYQTLITQRLRGLGLPCHPAMIPILLQALNIPPDQPCNGDDNLAPNNVISKAISSILGLYVTLPWCNDPALYDDLKRPPHLAQSQHTTLLPTHSLLFSANAYFLTATDPSTWLCLLCNKPLPAKVNTGFTTLQSFLRNTCPSPENPVFPTTDTNFCQCCVPFGKLFHDYCVAKCPQNTDPISFTSDLLDQLLFDYRLYIPGAFFFEVQQCVLTSDNPLISSQNEIYQHSTDSTYQPSISGKYKDKTKIFSFNLSDGQFSLPGTSMASTLNHLIPSKYLGYLPPKTTFPTPDDDLNDNNNDGLLFINKANHPLFSFYANITTENVRTLIRNDDTSVDDDNEDAHFLSNIQNEAQNVNKQVVMTRNLFLSQRMIVLNNGTIINVNTIPTINDLFPKVSIKETVEVSSAPTGPRSLYAKKNTNANPSAQLFPTTSSSHVNALDSVNPPRNLSKPSSSMDNNSNTNTTFDNSNKNTMMDSHLSDMIDNDDLPLHYTNDDYDIERELYDEFNPPNSQQLLAHSTINNHPKQTTSQNDVPNTLTTFPQKSPDSKGTTMGVGNDHISPSQTIVASSSSLSLSLTKPCITPPTTFLPNDSQQSLLNNPNKNNISHSESINTISLLTPQRPALMASRGTATKPPRSTAAQSGCNAMPYISPPTTEPSISLNIPITSPQHILTLLYAQHACLTFPRVPYYHHFVDQILRTFPPIMIGQKSRYSEGFTPHQATIRPSQLSSIIKLYSYCNGHIPTMRETLNELLHTPNYTSIPGLSLNPLQLFQLSTSNNHGEWEYGRDDGDYLSEITALPSTSQQASGVMTSIRNDPQHNILSSGSSIDQYMNHFVGRTDRTNITKIDSSRSISMNNSFCDDYYQFHRNYLNHLQNPTSGPPQQHFISFFIEVLQLRPITRDNTLLFQCDQSHSIEFSEWSLSFIAHVASTPHNTNTTQKNGSLVSVDAVAIQLHPLWTVELLGPPSVSNSDPQFNTRAKALTRALKGTVKGLLVFPFTMNALGYIDKQTGEYHKIVLNARQWGLSHLSDQIVPIFDQNDNTQQQSSQKPIFFRSLLDKNEHNTQKQQQKEVGTMLSTFQNHCGTYIQDYMANQRLPIFIPLLDENVLRDDIGLEID